MKTPGPRAASPPPPPPPPSRSHPSGDPPPHRRPRRTLAVPASLAAADVTSCPPTASVGSMAKTHRLASSPNPSSATYGTPGTPRHPSAPHHSFPTSSTNTAHAPRGNASRSVARMSYPRWAAADARRDVHEHRVPAPRARREPSHRVEEVSARGVAVREDADGAVAVAVAVEPGVRVESGGERVARPRGVVAVTDEERAPRAVFGAHPVRQRDASVQGHVRRGGERDDRVARKVQGVQGVARGRQRVPPRRGTRVVPPVPRRRRRRAPGVVLVSQERPDERARRGRSGRRPVVAARPGAARAPRGQHHDGRHLDRANQVWLITHTSRETRLGYFTHGRASVDERYRAWMSSIVSSDVLACITRVLYVTSGEKAIGAAPFTRIPSSRTSGAAPA